MKRLVPRARNLKHTVCQVFNVVKTPVTQEDIHDQQLEKGSEETGSLAIIELTCLTAKERHLCYKQLECRPVKPSLMADQEIGHTFHLGYIFTNMRLYIHKDDTFDYLRGTCWYNGVAVSDS